ncbi:M23 family metallopeptidase [Sphingomonas mesophila]|uniref:M23 family metallopeptidase n=1 Tax=Sphingomonas mesophila TaxID=2303576 RepID=UPI000E583F26|nr:M23 family metallopeptidase [Sphingomonas mesophila]
MIFLILQAVLPLILIALLIWRPGGRVRVIIGAVAVGAYLAAIQLAGLWLDVPWWTAWLWWALLAAALVAAVRRSSPPEGRGRWLALAGWSLLALGSGWLAVTALLGRRPPPAPPVALANPLPAGNVMVVNGGSRELINAHLETLHPRTARQAAHRGQSYGVDLVRLFPSGRHVRGWQPSDPARYAIWGTPVLAPCAGEVVARLDGRPDMPVPRTDPAVMGGNHVILRCGTALVVLAHLRRGSVAVAVAQRVRTGERVGEVGNSGNSDLPHLHVHAQRPGPPGAPWAGDPLPITIDGRYAARGDWL